MISAIKLNYRLALLQKRIEEGNDLKTFWKDFTILNAIYEVHSTWRNTKSMTTVRSWKNIITDISDGDDKNFQGFEDVDKKNHKHCKKCARSRGCRQIQYYGVSRDMNS